MVVATLNNIPNNVIIKFMETLIEKIDKQNIDEQIMEKAGDILKNGGLVAFPTETVYGLGANALDEEAARKTYEAKGRPCDNPLIVHIADVEALDAIVDNVSEKARKVIDRFWPGPLTLVFNKTDKVPLGTTGGLETVAVRMPVDEIALSLIRAGGGYISAPSANTSGRPSPTTAEHVFEDLNGKIDMIINTPVGKKGATDDSYIRKAAIKNRVPYMTTMAAAKATVEGIKAVKNGDSISVKSLQEFHAEIQ